MEQATSYERPVINIEGERLALGPVREDLLPLYQRWDNEFETIRTHIQTPAPMPLDVVRRWYERVTASRERTPFTVYEKETWRPVGLSGLMAVDHRNRNAEFHITIGEPDVRGKGYGTETTMLVLDYAFTALGLQNVMLAAVEYNLAGLRVYEKAGFREFGRRRKAIQMGGSFWDVVYMDILAEDFESPVLSRIFVPDPER